MDEGSSSHGMSRRHTGELDARSVCEATAPTARDGLLALARRVVTASPERYRTIYGQLHLRAGLEQVELSIEQATHPTDVWYAVARIGGASEEVALLGKWNLRFAGEEPGWLDAGWTWDRAMERLVDALEGDQHEVYLRWTKDQVMRRGLRA
jgi:hypothetical protein